MKASTTPVTRDRIDFDGLALRARTLRSRVVWRVIRRAAGALRPSASPATMHHLERRPA